VAERHLCCSDERWEMRVVCCAYVCCVSMAMLVSLIAMLSPIKVKPRL
jgi:hypothetical protein